MSETPFATGHCLCGAVSYTIKGEPIRTGQCHCKDCQRASGTGHMSLAFFNDTDLEIDGETAQYDAPAQSGNINTRMFCPRCGGRLFGRNSARPGIVAVAVGSVDDNAWFETQAIVYSKDRPPWDLMASDVPTFEAMPPPPK